jgi:hypothetical protein
VALLSLQVKMASNKTALQKMGKSKKVEEAGACGGSSSGEVEGIYRC